MRRDLIERFEGRRVPRYTSYPTAPHFSADIGPDDYAGWLAKLPVDAVLSLYLHVPFCRSICWYCGCHTKAARRSTPVDAHMDAMVAEVDLVAAMLPGRLAVGHIHWGGGTPTIADPASLARFMDRLRDRFAVADDAEIAIEIDPRTLTSSMAGTLASVGVNRASLGVQSFDPKVQAAIGRIQDEACVRAAADRLRRAGIAALNLDLMYGLPHQTADSCRDTARRALLLAPDRLSVFGYAHVPTLKPHQRLIDEAALPDGTARLDQFEAIATVLDQAGYRRIGLDHFARPGDAMTRRLDQGRLRRNFQGYTTDESTALIGLGASSIGALPGGYVQNAPDVGRYRAHLAEGRLPVVRGLALSADDRLRRAVIERLMCDFEVDVAAVALAHGAVPRALSDARPRLAALAADGVVDLDRWRVRVRDDCRPLVRSVAACFDAYLDAAPSRYSRAV